MLKVAVSGSTGRMGKEVVKLIFADPDRYKLAAEASRSLGAVQNWKASEVDAVIDFSLPEFFNEVFKWCEANNKPLVSGTTGFSLEEFSKPKFPFMHSGNYSMGVAALLKSIKNFKKMDSCLKVWIEDIHHIHKLDAPSGTAVKIKKEIEGSLGIKDVKIRSLREGEVFGVHRVHIESTNEHIVFEHEALNRGVFAVGALNATEWLAGQKSGVYKFEDYLNF